MFSVTCITGNKCPEAERDMIQCLAMYLNQTTCIKHDNVGGQSAVHAYYNIHEMTCRCMSMVLNNCYML